MKKAFLFSVLAMLVGIPPAYSQVNLSEMEQASADSLLKSRIRYFSPGMGGRTRVWDFSGKLGSKGSSQVKFMKDSTDVVSVMEPGRISYFLTTPDTLILIGSETPLATERCGIKGIPTNTKACKS